jgi:hypothetical protein
MHVGERMAAIFPLPDCCLVLGEEKRKKEQLIAVKYGFLKIATTVNILNSPGLLLSN